MSVVRAEWRLEGRAWERSVVERGAKGEWVFYPEGEVRKEAERRVLTTRILVELAPGRVVADLRGGAGKRKIQAYGRYRVVTAAGSSDEVLAVAAGLSLRAGVLKAEPLLARQQIARFIPNDPLFSYQAGQPGYQWH